MQNRHIKHPFGPIIDNDCRVLILGSVPSVKSAEAGFYYMHPQNRFWKVLSALCDEDFYSKSISERKALLLKCHIALYDSVEECDILGSSDADVSNITPADIPALITGTKITRIYCNGTLSYSTLTKYHPALANITTKLPSTSPANGRYSLEKLISEWARVAEALK